MIIEVLASYIGFEIYKNIKNRDLNEIKKRWNKLLLSSKKADITNYYGETFDLKKVYRTPFGYRLCIFLPYTLRITTLKDIEIDIIRIYNCNVDIKQNGNSYINIDLLYKEIGGD